MLVYCLLILSIALAFSCGANLWLLLRSRALAKQVVGWEQKEKARLRARGRIDRLVAVATAAPMGDGPATPRSPT